MEFHPQCRLESQHPALQDKNSDGEQKASVSTCSHPNTSNDPCNPLTHHSTVKTIGPACRRLIADKSWNTSTLRKALLIDWRTGVLNSRQEVVSLAGCVYDL